MISSLLCGLLLAGPVTLKVKVDGDGYLRFAREGRVVYAASATLTVTEGVLAGQGGATVLPSITVPTDATALAVDLEGNVSCKTAKGQFALGRLVLALFSKTAILRPADGYLVAADRPQLGSPGDGTNGVIRIDAPATVPPTPPIKKPEGTIILPGNKPKGGAAIPAKADVSVALTSEVSTDQIFLGDVAQINGDEETKKRLSQIVIGETPAIGVPRSIFEGHIVVRLRLAGIRPDEVKVTVPPGASVTRKCQRIAAERLIDVAKLAVKEKLGIDVPLTCRDRSGEFCAPVGQLEITAESCTRTSNGVTVIVAVRVDGKRVNSRVINLFIDSNAQGIKAGDAVKVLIHSGGATFEIAGKARSAGWIGQTITVVTNTGSSHSGTVISASTVEVKL
jgi:hypothetical protein